MTAKKNDDEFSRDLRRMREESAARYKANVKAAFERDFLAVLKESEVIRQAIRELVVSRCGKPVAQSGRSDESEPCVRPVNHGGMCDTTNWVGEPAP